MARDNDFIVCTSEFSELSELAIRLEIGACETVFDPEKRVDSPAVSPLPFSD